jgi:hypothetical protein
MFLFKIRLGNKAPILGGFKPRLTDLFRAVRLHFSNNKF